MTPGLPARYLVVRKVETDPPEVWAFSEDELEEARAHYDRVGAQWSETYLCEVLRGPLT